MNLSKHIFTCRAEILILLSPPCVRLVFEFDPAFLENVDDISEVVVRMGPCEKLAQLVFVVDLFLYVVELDRGLIIFTEKDKNELMGIFTVPEAFGVIHTLVRYAFFCVFGEQQCPDGLPRVHSVVVSPVHQSFLNYF